MYYPNHLARAVILAFEATDPVLSRMYRARWAIIPNLGTDLVLPPLLHVLPVHLAGRIVLGVAILLPVIGTIAFSRATFGTRSAWPLASGLVAYNGTLLLGFMNFAAAIGIALLLAAAWIAWRERYPGRPVALAGIGAVALFFCHLMGLVFFCVLIAGHEAGAVVVPRTRPSAILVRIAHSCRCSRCRSGCIRSRCSRPSHCHRVPVDRRTRPGSWSFRSLATSWRSTSPRPARRAFLLACVALGHCRITLNSGVTLVLVTALYLVTPWAFKGTYFLDVRFAIMLGFLLFGAVLPTGLPRATRFIAGGAFGLMFAVRMAVIAFAWHGHRHDVADLRAVIAEVEPGARVFLAAVSPEEAPQYWRDGPLSRRLTFGVRLDYHLPALLLIEHRAYWPFLFDNPSQQPVVTLQPYRTLADRARSLADHGALEVAGKVDLCGFDYLLLLEAGGEPDLANIGAGRLQLLVASDMAALFRVKGAACTP